MNNLTNARNTIAYYYQNNYKSLVEQNIRQFPKNNFYKVIKDQTEANPLEDNFIFSNKEKYEMIGKYDIRYDKKNNLVYSNDNNEYYKKMKNKQINNFQTSYSGFPNIGNSCYMNSFLQILLHTPNFISIIDQYNANNDDQGLLMNLYNLTIYPYNSIYLHNIKKIMGSVNKDYLYYEPGDSQRFAIDFIDKLISESKNENSFLDYSVMDENFKNRIEKYDNFIEKFNNKSDNIEKLFQFVEVSRGNFKILDNFSINLNIELNFPTNYKNNINIYDLLNMKYNEDLKIADLPEILIISLNRGITGKKLIKTNVSFPLELNIDKYIDKSLINNLQSKNYTLYAINERYGQSKNQGHYTCYIKIKLNPNKECWRYFSDLYVIDSEPKLYSTNVYGLYYYRKHK